MHRIISTRRAFTLLFTSGVVFTSANPLPDDYVARGPVTARGLAPRMRVKQLGATARAFQIVFGRGDEVASGLTEFAEKNHLEASHVTAVGDFASAVLGWFDNEKGAFKKIVIQEPVEIASFIGDVILTNGKPVFHAHVVVAFKDGSTKGGHLIEARVGPIMEVFVVDHSISAEAKAGQ